MERLIKVSSNASRTRRFSDSSLLRPLFLTCGLLAFVANSAWAGDSAIATAGVGNFDKIGHTVTATAYFISSTFGQTPGIELDQSRNGGASSDSGSTFAQLENMTSGTLSFMDGTPIIGYYITGLTQTSPTAACSASVGFGTQTLQNQCSGLGGNFDQTQTAPFPQTQSGSFSPLTTLAPGQQSYLSGAYAVYANGGN